MGNKHSRNKNTLMGAQCQSMGIIPLCGVYDATDDTYAALNANGGMPLDLHTEPATSAESFFARQILSNSSTSEQINDISSGPSRQHMPRPSAIQQSLRICTCTGTPLREIKDTLIGERPDDNGS